MLLTKIIAALMLLFVVFMIAWQVASSLIPDETDRFENEEAERSAVSIALIATTAFGAVLTILATLHVTK